MYFIKKIKNKICWYYRLIRLGIKNIKIINIISTMKGSPSKYSNGYLLMISDALVRNKKYNGLIWKSLQNKCYLSNKKRRRLIYSHVRHTTTNYNKLIKDGINIKWARKNKKKIKSRIY